MSCVRDEAMKADPLKGAWMKKTDKIFSIIKGRSISEKMR